MSDFEAKMHQIRFRLGLCPRPRWESLQRSPRPPNWILRGPTSKGGEGREGKGKETKGDGKGEMRRRKGRWGGEGGRKGGGKEKEGKGKGPLPPL